MILTPRYYQEDAINSIFQYFTDGGNGNPIVAMPTGTGKSLVIAEFIRRVFCMYPNQRIMMLTHVKELIEQNAERLLQIWPTAPLGIYSAGIGRRDTALPIIFGGVGSVVNNVDSFGRIDLVIIDECHLLSPKDDTMYQKIITSLSLRNPFVKIIGLTATHYRMKQGVLTEGDSIFTDICYDITGFKEFNKLIREGFLSPLIPKRTETEINMDGVSIIGGEYNKKQMEAAVDKDEITYKAVKEMVEGAYDRKSWLVFAASVDNAEHVAAMLQSFGIDSVAVHSKLSKKLNDERINSFKSGEIRCIVNNKKLTTGFDHPPIDFIGDLLPTMSPGLHVQKYGRGTRPAPGKENCLVFDFAKNTRRLGPINDPVLPRKPGKKTGPSEVPIKICDKCGFYNHASARFCDNPECGHEFTFKSKLVALPDDVPLIKSDMPQIELLDVKTVFYNLHEKKGAPPSIKVSYVCGTKSFSEWVCLEHPGHAGLKAKQWWLQRIGTEPPLFTYQALKEVSKLKVPARIKVHVNKKYPEILGHEF